MDRLRFAYLTACAPLCLVSALIEKAVGELVERCFLAPLRWVEVQPINSQLELRLSENTDLAGMIRRSPPNKGSSHVLSRRFPEGNWTYALNLPATRVFLVKAAFKGEFIISIRIDGTTYADSQSYTYPHQMPDTVCTERNAVFWELPMRFAVTNLRLEDFEAMYMTRQGQEGFWRHYLTLWIKYATGEQIKEAGTLLKEEWLR